MQHDGSAYLSTKRQIEDAEDRGERKGIARGISLAAEWLETAKQNKPLADELRAAQIVERTEG